MTLIFPRKASVQLPAGTTTILIDNFFLSFLNEYGNNYPNLTTKSFLKTPIQLVANHTNIPCYTLELIVEPINTVQTKKEVRTSVLVIKVKLLTLC